MADKQDIILGEVRGLRSEFNEFRREVWGEIQPLQAEAAVSEEHRDTCKQKHSNLTTIAVAVLVVVLGAAGFAFASWINTKVETDRAPIVKTLP